MSESDYCRAVRETQRQSCTADEPDEDSAPPVSGVERHAPLGEEVAQGDRAEEAAIPPGSSADGGDTCEDR